MKLITIIIPVYNRPEAFEKTLDSVLRQSYENIEVIVVDDGSIPPISKGTMEQRSNDKCVKFFRQENKGAPVARNRGFDESKGEYVIFIDGDVVMKNDMIEKMYRVLEEQSGFDFVYCNFELDGKPMRAKEFSLQSLQERNFISPMSLMRREAFPRFDENLKKFQDWDLFLTMAEYGAQGFWIDEILFETVGGGTMSRWMPSFAYKKPWKYLPWFRSYVRGYEDARDKVYKKHKINV